MTRQAFWHIIALRARPHERELSPHTLRHAFATHLPTTAPTCVVQMLLGHSDLSTTQSTRTWPASA